MRQTHMWKYDPRPGHPLKTTAQSAKWLAFSAGAYMRVIEFIQGPGGGAVGGQGAGRDQRGLTPDGITRLSLTQKDRGHSPPTQRRSGDELLFSTHALSMIGFI